MPVRKRADSPYWQIHIGRTTRFSSGTEDKAAAEEIERTERERIFRLEKLGDRGAIPWDEAAERWLNSSAREKKREREILAWLSPIIGREAVRDVAEPDSLEELRNDSLEMGWSQSTTDRVMATVRAVLIDCVRRRDLEQSPMVPMFHPPQDEPRYLTPAQFEQLCRYLPMHLVLAARVAVNTLLRMRAMLNLTWDRVDLVNGRAWVPRRQQKGRRNTFGLPLNIEAVRALRGLRSMCLTSSPHVFTWYGQPIDDCNTRAFQEAVRISGVPYICWHDLRHTGASWAVQNGVTLQELMLLGDWKDYRSVLRYAHLAPTQAASAADKVAQMSHAGREASSDGFENHRMRSAS
jgi:integrase